MKLIDLTGQKFNRLFVVGRSNEKKRNRVAWDCLCDCGNAAVISGDHLRRGESKSCGCLVVEAMRSIATTHGKSRTRVHRIWLAMKARCHRKTYPERRFYGGRGISVCDRWRNSFEAFYEDMGDCPPGRSIDRIDNDGNYEPGNCRWATWDQQISNRRKRGISRKTRNYGPSQATFPVADMNGQV